MPNLLSFEASSPVLSIALKKGSATTVETTVDGFMKHSENLLTAMDNLLKQNGLTLNDIDTYLIGRGPGSFTGLRVGFATLKGFLASLPKPVYGTLSLDTIANAVSLPGKSLLAVCLNAYREKVFVRIYESSVIPAKAGIQTLDSRLEHPGMTMPQWAAKTEAETLTVAELIEKLPAHCTLTGDAVEKYQTVIEKSASSKNLRFLGPEAWYPKASSMISNFLSDPKTFSKLESPADFIPLYFRLSEAEERRQEHVNRG